MEEIKVGVIYKEIIEGIKILPLEQQAKIYNAIFEYQFTGQITDDDMFVKSFILSHKTNFDNMKSRREASIENGRLGGAPKGNQNARKTTQNNLKQPKTTQNNQETTENNLKQEARSKKQEVKSKKQEEINKKECLEEKSAESTKTQNKFVKPTNEELKDFALQEHLRTDIIAEFMDYYDSNGWRVGKAGLPMKDWKATYRRWCRNQHETKEQLQEKERKRKEEETMRRVLENVKKRREEEQKWNTQ